MNYRYDWWTYMKAIVRRFPSRQANPDSLGEIQRREVHAVSEAIRRTEAMEDGDDRIKLVKAVYWSRHRKTGLSQILCKHRRAMQNRAKII